MTARNLPAPGPTIPSKRITSLDVLRGLAVMGILIANIESFAMPHTVSMYPTFFGGFTGFDYVVAMVTRILVRGKFLTIFSMLFGAGVVLMTQRLEKKGGEPARRHYLRMIWLLMIGGVHSSIIWNGDILVQYALCGLLIFPFRKLSPRKLMIYAVVLLFIPHFQFTLQRISYSYRLQQSAADGAKHTRTTPARRAKLTLEQYVQKKIDMEIKIHRQGWVKQTSERTGYFLATLKAHVTRPLAMLLSILNYCAWMLIGMALFKWNMLNARAPAKTYRKFLFLGLGIGLFLPVTNWVSRSLYGWTSNLAGTISQVKWLKATHSFLAYKAGHLLLCLGYVAIVMLVCRSGKLPRLTGRMAALGRMALTNYLMHSVICTFLFNGYGFGLFGKIERSGQFLIALAILIFQLWLSPLWLKRFRFGPAEWLWRSLSYWQRQPMRKKRGVS